MTETEDGQEKLAEVAAWRDSILFSVSERVALEYAERVTYSDQKVDDAFFAEVKKHFTEAQIVELTFAVALENFRSKFNPTLGVEAQGFCVGRICRQLLDRVRTFEADRAAQPAPSIFFDHWA